MQIVSKKIDTDKRLFSIIKRLVSETGWQHAPQYGLAFLLTAIVAGTTAGIALILEDVVNEIFVNKNLTALYAISASIFLIFVLRGFATFGKAVILKRISNAIVLEVKVKLFGRVLAKEPSYVMGSSSAEMMMIVNKGSGSATGLLNTLALAIGRDLFTLIALLGVMFVQNWVLALAMVAAVPIIAVVVTAITVRLRNLNRRRLKISTMLTNRIRASIQGIKTVKAFGIEGALEEHMKTNAKQLRDLAYKQAVVSNRLAPFMEMVGGVIIAGVILIGGWRVIEHGDTPGELVSFMFAALMIYDPARRLGQARTGIEKHLVGLRLMYDFLDRRDEEVDPPHAKPVDMRAGDVTFENVRFSYDGQNRVLRNMSFTARGGETTALVGRSGAGKTTVATLLLRFWRPNKGRILIDGQDLNDITADSLRGAIAYVGQEAFLFDGTILENLSVGRQNATREEIEQAARDADAYEFITRLPQGFDTRVGELGGNLSGGQKQRLTIARALLKDAPIVLLDEPTSALDGETERGIQASLKRLARGRTTIVIAHRLSTIQHADQILVVEAGRVMEAGTHAELIDAGGQYSRLYAENLDEEAEERAEAAARAESGAAQPASAPEDPKQAPDLEKAAFAV